MAEADAAPPTLRAQEHALAAHVRDPAATPPPPGMEERRLKIYRELFYNSIEGLLAGNFPVIRRTLGDAPWHALVRAFYAGHRARTPLFTEIGREFVEYLQARGDALDPPWLAELAHYEWVELALQIAADELPAHDAGGDLLAGRPVLSPLAWPLAYRWPVAHIGPDHRPMEPPVAPTLLLVRRDAGGLVHFSRLSPLVFRLLQLLAAPGARSGGAVIAALAAEAMAPDVNAFVADGEAMLRRLHAEGVVLGTQPA